MRGRRRVVPESSNGVHAVLKKAEFERGKKNIKKIRNWCGERK